MSEWQEHRFSDVLVDGNISYGIVQPGSHTEIDSVPIIRVNNIKNGKIQSDDVLKVASSIEQKYQRTRLQGGELLITVVGSVGECAIVPDSLKGWNVARAVSVARITDDFDKRYIKYCFKSEDLIFQMYGNTNDTVQPTLNLSSLKSLVLSIPSLPEQKAIAAVLSSLDDKIDLLHRQNKTLEVMAASLFRQWFVEDAQEVWEEVTLSDITARITDGSHASPPTVEVGLPMASVKDMYQWGINTESCRQISQDDFDELVRTDCRPLKNDILIAKDGSYLKHVFVAEEDMDVVILSSIAILRPNGKYHPLLLATFLKLESTKEGLANIVTGAVIPRIVLKDFRKYKLLLPPQPLQDHAIATIQPIYEKCWENDRQIRTLEKLRDNLLPKLMSGEVRVEV